MMVHRSTDENTVT